MLRGRIKYLLWMSVAVGVLAIGGNVSNLQMPKTSRVPIPSVVSDTGKFVVWKNKAYVLIDNKWFEQRSDNIYNVKGVKTFYAESAQTSTSRSPSAVAMQEVADSADERSTALLKN